MTNRFLFDTNAVIAFRADPTPFHEAFAAKAQWCISVVSLGELGFGALKSPRPDENMAWLLSFADDLIVLNCDRETANGYGQIRDALRRAGLPIPANDTWIAATALQHDLVLVTRDAHFDNNDGLSVQTW